MSLFWIHWFPLSNLLHLLLAKFVYGTIGCAILWYTYKIFRLKFDFKISILLLCFLFFNPLVFWDLPQAKADILCLFFMLAGLYNFFIKKRRLFFVFCILAFLATPKSILFFPFLFFIYFNELNYTFEFNFKKKLWLARILIIAFILLWLCRSVLEKFVAHFSLPTYSLAFRYAKDLLAASLREGFYNIDNSYFVLFFVDYLLPSIVAAFFFLFLKNLVVTKNHVFKFLILIFYTTSAVGIYPLKHPYFLIPLFFLLLISVFFLFDFKLENLFQKHFTYCMVFFFIHFSYNIYGIISLSKMNLGLNQFRLISNLESLAKINNQALIADGTGALPRSKLLPQFVGLYDPVSNDFALNEILHTKPDLLFLTPKLALLYMELINFVQTEYVFIAPLVATKKVLVATNLLLLSSRQMLNDLKNRFSFPIRIVSFRTDEVLTENNPINATCADSFIEKDQWTHDEFESCSQFFFKYIPAQKDGKNINVFVVPWPKYEKNWPQSISAELNYKNIN